VRVVCAALRQLSDESTLARSLLINTDDDADLSDLDVGSIRSIHRVHRFSRAWQCWRWGTTAHRSVRLMRHLALFMGVLVASGVSSGGKWGVLVASGVSSGGKWRPSESE
jgi:hypothetical protein